MCACVHVIVLVGAEVGGNDIKSRSRAFDDGLLAHTKRLILQTTWVGERERVKGAYCVGQPFYAISQIRIRNLIKLKSNYVSQKK